MSELGSLLELVGPEATLKLIEEYGGVRLRVPPRMKAKHRLRGQIGESAMALLVQYFGGSELDVPLARQWRIEMYLAAGMGATEAARKTGCSRWLVYNTRSKLAARHQLSFDFDSSGKTQAVR